MEINGQETVNINGKDYWTIEQFAILTERTKESVRRLLSIGNSIRRLDADRIGRKPFIPYEELFEYPFVQDGRQSALGILVKKYYLEDGELLDKEEVIARCP